MEPTADEAEPPSLPTFGLDADAMRGWISARRESPPSRRQRMKTRARQAYLSTTARALSPVLSALERAGVRGRVACRICGWQGVEFRPLVGPGWMQRNARCPGCLGLQRQRLLALALEREKPSGRILWVAPEDCLRRMIEKQGTEVITADLSMPDVDIRADIEALPFATGSVECMVISHVLEHVADDHAALREVRRVLAASGIAFIHVPILTTETVEYGFVNEGDFGHRRAYGPDIAQRLADAAVDLIPFRADQFSPTDRRRYGLLDWDVVVLARLQGHRP